MKSTLIKQTLNIIKKLKLNETVSDQMWQSIKPVLHKTDTSTNKSLHWFKSTLNKTDNESNQHRPKVTLYKTNTDQNWHLIKL